ncbi:MAG: hypothetical protein R3B68_12080 [Phycisphaerales bacterium]
MAGPESIARARRLKRIVALVWVLGGVGLLLLTIPAASVEPAYRTRSALPRVLVDRSGRILDLDEQPPRSYGAAFVWVHLESRTDYLFVRCNVEFEVERVRWSVRPGPQGADVVDPTPGDIGEWLLRTYGAMTWELEHHPLSERAMLRRAVVRALESQAAGSSGIGTVRAIRWSSVVILALAFVSLGAASVLLKRSLPRITLGRTMDRGHECYARGQCPRCRYAIRSRDIRCPECGLNPRALWRLTRMAGRTNLTDPRPPVWADPLSR